MLKQQDDGGDAYLQKNLTWRQVLVRVRNAMDHKKPFSLVRIGDGENICLAQNSVWRMRNVLKEPWAVKANRGERGVNLPNIRLRNELVRAIRKANIVGILPRNDKRIHAPTYLKRPLTNKIFAYYHLKPRYTCDACINRYIPKYKEFWKLLKGRKILLITQHAKPFKRILTSRYGLNVTGTIYFSHHRQIGSTLKRVASIKNKFDLALISAGVNAVVLAPEVARISGKAAIDFGQGHREFKKHRRLI